MGIGRRNEDSGSTSAASRRYAHTETDPDERAYFGTYIYTIAISHRRTHLDTDGHAVTFPDRRAYDHSIAVPDRRAYADAHVHTAAY